MAVNINYLMEKGLSYYDFTVMQLIAQNTDPHIHEEIIIHMTDESLTRLQGLDMLKLVKLKRKSDHEYTRLRLSKKGKETFRNAQIVDYTKADEALFERLSGLYAKLDKPVGNDVKTKGLIAWFRVENQYSRRMLYFAVKYFLLKHEEEGKTKYIPTLENLFWKSDNVFSTKWTLSNSRLYQFIQENKKSLNGYISNQRQSSKGKS
jgi:hypothetical protein